MNKWLAPVVDAYRDYFVSPKYPVIWEVGSRDGRDAVELAQRIFDGSPSKALSSSTVVCLEPNPDQAQIIRDNYPEVSVIEVAASDKTGEADFMVYHGDDGAIGSSSLNLDWKEDDLEGHVIKVKTVRLEELVPNYQIDIMKIDVESYSLQVLQGLGDKLDQIKVLHVETEDWTKSDKKVKRYLSSRGWKLVDERQEWSGMPDLCFINANLVGR